jgi:hypothetical protein
MDDELRQAFASLSASVSSVANDASATNVLTRQTLSEVRQLGSRVSKLERHVFGSDPPPAIRAPLTERITQNEDDTVDLTGRLMNVAASQQEMRGELQSVRDELDKQSRQMGIGMRGAQWATSKEGRKTLVSLATLTGALYTALHAAGLFH